MTFLRKGKVIKIGMSQCGHSTCDACCPGIPGGHPWPHGPQRPLGRGPFVGSSRPRSAPCKRCHSRFPLKFQHIGLSLCAQSRGPWGPWSRRDLQWPSCPSLPPHLQAGTHAQRQIYKTKPVNHGTHQHSHLTLFTLGKISISKSFKSQMFAI